MLYPNINENDFQELKEMLEEAGGEELEVWVSMGRLFMNGLDTELMLRFDQINNKLYIARIKVRNKRRGIGTFVLKWLEDYATKNGYTTIIIESTTTREINRFAEKHGFKPNKLTGIEEDGEFFGNWEKVL